MPDDLSPYLPYIPDGCMPAFGIMVFGYLDDEGRLCGGWHYDGEVEIATLFGHMELAKHFLARSEYQEPDEDD